MALIVTELSEPRTWLLYLLEIIFYFFAARSFSTRHGARKMATSIIPEIERIQRRNGEYLGTIPKGIDAKVSLLEGTPRNCPALVFENDEDGDGVLDVV